MARRRAHACGAANQLPNAPAGSGVESLEARRLLDGSGYANRGWVSVIVDQTIAADLAPRLAQFKQDLVADGWTVAPNMPGVDHSAAPRMDDENYVWNNAAGAPVTLEFDAQAHHLDQYKRDLQKVKDIVAADQQAAINAGSRLAQIILVGHVTVPYSGAVVNPFNQHEPSAGTSDAYYADFDGSPVTWADRSTLITSGNDLHYECTTNQPGDGRFDASTVPGDALQFTINGSSGSFQFAYSDVNPEDPTETHAFNSAALPANATADQVRDALNNMLSPLSTAYATVVQTGNAFAVRLLDSDGSTAGFDKTLTASAAGGVSVSSTTLPTGGTECAIGRIDLANLDSAFPLLNDSGQPLNSGQIERALLNRYFDKDHKWRMGEVQASRALIDQTSEDVTDNEDPPTYLANEVAARYQLHVGGSDVIRNSGTWVSEFSKPNPSNYLFAALVHPGYIDGITSATGNNPPSITSYHFNQLPAQGVFMSSASSWSRDWNNRSFRATYNTAPQDYYDGHGNAIFPTQQGYPFKSALQRSVLAAQGISLVSTWWRGWTDEGTAGMFDGPTPLRLGYTAGDGFLHSADYGPAWTFEELMGDPTVRAAYPKPVSGIVTETINLSNGQTTLNWPASGDAGASGFLGYNIYRASALDGAFTKVNSGAPITALSYTDTSNPSGQYVYMVRAIKIETNPGGTYENASTGVFASKVVLQGKDSSSDNADAIQVRRVATATDNPIGIWTTGISAGSSADYLLDSRTTASIEVNGNSGNDRLMLDFRAGNPVPSGGVKYYGGSGSDDSLMITGSSGTSSPDVITFGSASITANGGTITYDGALEAIRFNGVAGNDNITINRDTAVTLSKGLPESLDEPTGVVSAHQFGSLKIDGINAKAALNATGSDGTHNGNQLVVATTLEIVNGGTLDLANNDMIVHGGSYATTAGLISSARNGGAWNGPGLTSSAAITAHNTTLGVLTGTQFQSVYGGSATFDNFSIVNTDLLVKYTYYGDADFNGIVNFDDYSRADGGFNGGGSTWFQGDFDYSGAVNFDDYSLIDNAFNTQSDLLIGNGRSTRDKEG